jgi:hypothetical protein
VAQSWAATWHPVKVQVASYKKLVGVHGFRTHDQHQPSALGEAFTNAPLCDLLNMACLKLYKVNVLIWCKKEGVGAKPQPVVA